MSLFFAASTAQNVQKRAKNDAKNDAKNVIKRCKTAKNGESGRNCQKRPAEQKKKKCVSEACHLDLFQRFASELCSCLDILLSNV